MAFPRRSEERAERLTADEASLRQTVALIASLPEVEPPADLRRRVEAGLAQTKGLRHVGCAQVAEAVDAYLDGELKQAEERALHLHLAGCRACRREVEQARTAVRLTQGLGEVAPPVCVRERIAAEMAKRARPRWRLRPIVKRVLLSAVPVAAAAALVLAVSTQGPQPEAPGAVATAPPVAATQPADQPAAEPATAAAMSEATSERESVAPVAVAHRGAAVAPRARSTVRNVITRIGDSLSGGSAAAAHGSAAGGAAGTPAPGPAHGEVAVSVDGTREVEEGPSDTGVVEVGLYTIDPDTLLYEKLAWLSAAEVTPTPAAPAAEKPAKVEESFDVSVAEPTALPEPTRRTLNVPRTVRPWPDAVNIERNEPRSVDLPLFRKAY